VKIRIIGVKGCSRCRSLVNSYTAQKVKFEYWDADDPLHEKALDEMKIDTTPVVQVVRDDGTVAFQSDPMIYKGGIAYCELRKIMSKIERNQDAN